jgi:DNA-binding LacI/PurR family transcriptional regulator
MLLGIQDRFDGTNYTVHVLKWHNDFEVDRKVFEDFATRHFTSGVILLSQKVDHKAMDILKRANISVILAEYCDPTTTSITIDNEKGGYLAGKHLIERGCRNIAAIGGWPNDTFTEERVRGFKKALKEAGLVSRGEFHFKSNFKLYEGGYNAAKKILEQGPKVDGIFAAVGDIAAVGAMRYIKEKGLSIPADIRVVGYDGLQDSAYFDPPLTTVHQPLFELGHKAADRLLADLKKREKKVENIILEPKLIVRESS